MTHRIADSHEQVPAFVELCERGGQVRHVSVDLADPDAPAGLVDAARSMADQRRGRLDHRPLIASDGGWSAAG
ncbi:MAG: hypothetical protein JO364_02630 [Pseudonocardiales bacterium]|nr:hypothetical protein [Pseudonocardiales bacterium]MBV9029207.1 hypothetical protein [Pseudonocardiales bacterium]